MGILTARGSDAKYNNLTVEQRHQVVIKNVETLFEKLYLLEARIIDLEITLKTKKDETKIKRSRKNKPVTKSNRPKKSR